MIKFIEAINTITNKKNKKRGFPSNVIKLRNDGFEGNTKNVLLFFLWKI